MTSEVVDLGTALLAGAAVSLVVQGLSHRQSAALSYIEAEEAAGPLRPAAPSALSLARLRADMARAGWQLRLSELAAIVGLAALLLAFFATLAFKTVALGIPVGLAASAVGTFYALRFSIQRRQRLIDTQIIQALTLMSGLLGVGKMVPAAFAETAGKVGAPLSAELQWVADQYAAGADLAVALRRVGERLGSSEWDYLTTAIDMQQSRGGDLVKVLSKLTGTVATRVQLRGTMKALLAESQMTKLVAGGVPVFLFFLMSYVNPAQTKMLLTTRPGIEMFIAAIVLWAAGLFFTSRMVAKVQP